MKYFFLLFLGVFVFSVNSEAQDYDYSLQDAANSIEYTPPVRNNTRTATRSAPKRAAPKPAAKTTKASSTPTHATSTCKRPTNYRSVCQYGWDDALCNCIGSNAKTQPAANNPNAEAVQQVIQKCQAQLVEARNDCDQEQDTGVKTAEGEMKTLASKLGQMGFGACSAIGKGIAGANAAVAVFAQMCSSAKSDCTASCKTAVSAAQSTNNPQLIITANESLQGCAALDAKIAEARNSIASTVSTIQGAQSCANDTTSELYDFCQDNPTAVGCGTAGATDCSNPSVAASNPICICKANPTAASCQGISLKADGGGFGNFDSASSGIPNGTSGSGSDIGGILDSNDFAGDPNLKPKNEKAEDIGGSKGGRPLGDSGGAGGGGGKDGAGGGAPGTGVAVNAGFRGGGGGGGGFGSAPGTWVAEGQGAGAPGAVDANGNPDLRQFLPGGKFDPKNRGLAGLSGPDGITGPNSNIWMKIQNRYQVKQPSLMP